MDTTQQDIGKGLEHLADAVHFLRAAQESIEAELARKAPGCPEEKLALGLTRVLAHVSQACGDVPDEMWAMMLARHSDMPAVKAFIQRVAAA